MFYWVLGLIVVSLICTCLKFNKLCIVLLSVAGLIYIVNEVSHLLASFAFFGYVGGETVVWQIGFLIVFLILFVLALVFSYKNKYKTVIWLISIMLFLYLLCHWNTELSHFFRIKTYIQNM